MRKLKRSECAVLPLVLKGKWYDMIASGEKREEYREFKQHWMTRIINWRESYFDNFKDYMVIEFMLGSQKDAPRMAFECEEVWSPDGCGLWNHGSRGDAYHPEWGEPSNSHYYTLQLGERVELVD